MTYYFNWFQLATERMIRSHFVGSGLDFVEVNWTRPKHLPERYQLSYLCTAKPPCTLKKDRSNYETRRMRNLSSDCNSVKIPDLRPNSICILILLAVYNPASIDAGLAILGAVLDEDARNTCTTSGQYIYIYVFLYLYICIVMINYCYKSIQYTYL